MLTHSPAAIIEAPSGYGKTTAVRDYLEDAAKHGDEVYWFTAVDEAPTALYRRFCDEMDKIDPHTGERLKKADFPNAFTIGEVCDALRSVSCHRKAWLVIDGFEHICSVLPPSFLAALLDHDGYELHVVIITQPLGQDFLSVVAGRGILHITVSDLQWEADDIRLYFRLAGAKITKTTAQEVMDYTNGWIIAVYLQLCSYLETGNFSDEAVLQLMEYLVWNKMTEEQQHFFLQLSVFEAYTVKQMCYIINCDELPGYTTAALANPFIRYAAEHRQYKPHTILFELFKLKRCGMGQAFERACLIKTGDLCRQEGRIAEAIAYYLQVKDYERILSLNLSFLVNAETGDSGFAEISLAIIQDCPADIRIKHPLAMLCIAWAIRLMDRNAEFDALLDELDGYLPDTGLFRAEWLLLSVYRHYPRLEEMLTMVRKAAGMFEGIHSQVIMPEAPWAFYEYFQLTAFHTHVGEINKEADMLEKFITLYARLTGGHGSGADILFRAETAYLRGDTAKAEIFAFKAVFIAESKQQKTIQIGAARLLASIALLKSDASGWQQAVSAMERAASGSAQNTSMFRTVLDVVRGSLLAELRDFQSIAGWLKDDEAIPRQLPVSIYKNALAVHMLYLMGQGENARLIGFGQSLSFDDYTAFSDCIYYLIMAVGHASMEDHDQASACLERFAAKALPDGMIHYFAGFSPLLQGLSDKLMENRYSHLLARFKDYKEQYITGWYTLHNAIVANELPSGLTGREHEIAMLAADGLRNSEIAEKLYVSENTVRAHLRAVYQKLDIDRRAKLAQKLK